MQRAAAVPRSPASSSGHHNEGVPDGPAHAVSLELSRRDDPAAGIGAGARRPRHPPRRARLVLLLGGCPAAPTRPLGAGPALVAVVNRRDAIALPVTIATLGNYL